MRIDILSLFPEMFTGVLGSSILKRAQEGGHLSVGLVNIRDFSNNKHRTVDDYPFGGGPGMVLKVEPVISAVESVPGDPHVILMTPQGRPLRQERAHELSELEHLLIVCGHYEGIDERVRVLLQPEEISIGDYILTGGELPAMVLVDAVARMLPGVLGESAGGEDESFYQGLLEYPQYTRPQEFRGLVVPEVLVSGHHEKVDRWRREQAVRRTWERRPELLREAELTKEDRRLLAELNQSKPEKE
ncbi:MAG: tRNA (guanosine(37)-N1)-methyltransferase TrmD [Firmicutes bacterium]|nr:tRNA (guanosine(37)-N1)-methyltransferase TrmD [Bacillota bacterium]